MKKLLFVLLLSISSFVHAQWTLATQNNVGLLYVDKSSIQQHGSYMRMCERHEYFENSDAITTSKMRSSRILVEYDCREKKSRYLSYQAFKEPDLKNAYPQDNRFDEWSFIAPGTLAAITLNIACKK